MNRAEFAAQRSTDQTDMEKTLFPIVSQAIAHYPATGWYNDLLDAVEQQYLSIFHNAGGDGQPSDLADFIGNVRATLDKTDNPDDTTVDRISTWLATAILNAASTEAAASGETAALEWVTMHDDRVRDTHRLADGQVRPVGDTFTVGGYQMAYPGDPTAPIELWINCRCALKPTALTAALEVEMTSTVDDSVTETNILSPVPWYGVLAPEGVWSGDGRRFAENSLRFRDLPLPLTWQKASGEGHSGSVTVAKIEKIARTDGQMRATGHFLMTPEADEAMGLVMDFGRYGVSVDADDVAETPEFDDDGKVTFTSARIASASMVSIPAFAEAFVALGEPPGGFMGGDIVAEAAGLDDEFKDYTPKQRKKAHTAPGTDSYPIEDCEDLRNAIQAIGRAKDPAKIKRHIKTQKQRLGCPDVKIPDGWADEADEFGRGPGWITNPEDTKRIHDYWTVPGEEGYEKIGWGTPGDFDRCRVEVGQEIAEKDPATVAKYMNQICAQWHHDALGRWPAEDKGVESVDAEQFDAAPALGLVASGYTAPAAWFTNPNLPGPTPLTVTDDGRVFGHVAEWGTCHTGYADMCVTPPHSETNYAYFLTGEVVTDSGRVPVGQITVGGGHAAHNLGVRAAMEHYDSTSAAAADVTCGEDDHGIWVAGWVRPGATDEQVYAMRAAGPSGDWRRVGQHPAEMIAAHCVNVQGFPIPRPTVGVKDGVQVSLVAAGMVAAPDEPFTLEALADLVEHAITDRQGRRLAMSVVAQRVWSAEHPSVLGLNQRRQRMAELAARVNGGGDESL